MANFFDNGVSGLVATQRALATTGHNIANVGTEGYTRQRVDLSARLAQRQGNGYIGSGVAVSSVRRVLEGFLLGQLRASASAHAEVSLFHDLSAQIDNLLADPEGGLAPALEGLFGSLQDLGTDPASIPARQLVLSEAEALTHRFRALEGRFGDLEREVEGRLASTVDEVNAMAADLARINDRIVIAEGAVAGEPANDLRDQRDQLVRDLAERVEVSTLEQDDGTLSVFLASGEALVVGKTSMRLALAPSPYDSSRSEVAIDVGGNQALVSTRLSGGELAGLLDFRSRVLDAGANALGRVAAGLAAAVNVRHALGMTLDGSAGGAVFNDVASLAPRVLPHAANTGSPAAAIDVRIADHAALTASDYELRRTGASYELTRLEDGQTTTLGSFPPGPEFVDGLRLELAAGAIADGDRFLIQPTRAAARIVDLALREPADLAAASPVRAEVSLANAGDASVTSLAVNSPRDTLSFSFTAPGVYDVRDETTGATLATGVAYAPGAPIAYNGVQTAISGVPAAGDVFRVVRGISEADAGNAGTGVVAEAVLSPPDPALTDPVTLTFDSPPGTFTVTGATTGTPTAGVPYASGAPVSFNGWTVVISGQPQAGDTITIGPNAGGVGDNATAAALADLAVSNELNGATATLQETYGQLVAEVGTMTRQAEINQAAQSALLEQAQRSRDAVSGVNLDEEAADLLRFQQAYQANAQVIAIAGEAFDSLLAAVGR